jgi:ferredoxin
MSKERQGTKVEELLQKSSGTVRENCLKKTVAKSKTFVIMRVKSNEEVQTMAYKITDECISCGACAAECPVEAIAEGDGKYEINPDVCIECGNCAEVCPVGAPKAE